MKDSGAVASGLRRFAEFEFVLARAYRTINRYSGESLLSDLGAEKAL